MYSRKKEQMKTSQLFAQNLGVLSTRGRGSRERAVQNHKHKNLQSGAANPRAKACRNGRVTHFDFWCRKNPSVILWQITTCHPQTSTYQYATIKYSKISHSVYCVLSAVPFWDLTFGKSVLVSELPYLFRRDSQPVTWCRFLDRVYRDIWKLLFKILKVPRAIIRHSFAYKNQACQWANCRVFRAVLGRISKKPITEHLRQDRTFDRLLTEIQTSSSNLYRFCSLSLL